MLPDLRLKNYRAFEDYTIENLGQVNLLVGLNNSGKSSVLEAVRIIAGEGIPWVLAKILLERNETTAVNTLENGIIFLPNVSHLFYGHQIREINHGIELKSGDKSCFYGSVSETELNIANWKMNGRIIPIKKDGAFNLDPLEPSDESSIYIPTKSLEIADISMLWGRLIKSKMEECVYPYLRILDERVRNVHFISYERNEQTEILVELEGEKERLPFGSLGDGMRRVLSLAIGINAAKDSILLVDEIDSGLHMSVIAKVWEMLIKTAMELNVQIFATTHSYDCLKGLADCIAKNTTDCEGVRVHRIDRSLKKAITFPADQVRIAMKNDIEIRG